MFRPNEIGHRRDMTDRKLTGEKNSARSACKCIADEKNLMNVPNTFSLKSEKFYVFTENKDFSARK